MTAPTASTAAGGRRRGHGGSRRRTNQLTAGVALAAGLVATFAPFAFTGSGPVDAVERFLLAGAVAHVGSRTHRRTWFVIGAIAAIPARGVALALVVAGLAIGVVGARSRARSKALGAAAAGAFANAVLWYPALRPAALAPIVAVVVVVTLLVGGIQEMRSGPRRAVASGALALAAITLVGVAGAGWAALSIRGDVEVGTSKARSALAAIKRGDNEEAQLDLAEATSHLDRADRRLRGPSVAPAHLVPGLAQQVHAIQVAVAQASSVSQAGDDLVTIDYDDLRYQGRIDLATVSDLEPSADRARTALADAERRLDALDDDWLVGPIRSRVDDFRTQVASARDDADLAHQLLGVVPGLLGGEGDRRYLVVFLQPAELRGSGGFVGNYAELSAVDGKVDLTRSGRIDDLISAVPAGQRTLSGPADYLARYGRFDPADHLQDLTLSPNWPSVARAYAELYPQSGGQKVDGVIGVDPKGLAALLQLTGPVDVPELGRTLTAANAVQLLTIDQYVFLGDRATRAEILEAATRATFTKLTRASLPAPRRLGDVLGPAARGRHLQLWSRHPAQEDAFDRLGATGRLEVPEGDDGFSIIQQNVGNSKIDAFLHREVNYQATLDARTGRLRGTVRVTLRNEVPRTDLPVAVVGNTRGLPVGTNLSQLSIATSQVVTSATVDGRTIRPVRTKEAGLGVYDLPLVDVPPGGTVEVVFQVVGGVDLRDGYHLRYLPQPMANPERFAASVAVRGGTFDRPGAGGRLRVDRAAEAPVEADAPVRR